ncbi:MAG TPA: hypothetical protein VN031_03180 [Candidatus Microsaccharimonas sp.]|nr:hypothetical protein [Candidatus Microsaccharimonas sp.]
MAAGTIVLCSSANFYQHVNDLADELEKLGFIAVVPHNAKMMKESGNYDPAAYKTWYGNADDFDKKAQYMRWHFDEIAKGDAVLVVNDTKHGVDGYIGSNVLLEMGLAFYLHKPIFILNPVDTSLANYEEVYGMAPVFLASDLSKISF